MPLRKRNELTEDCADWVGCGLRRSGCVVGILIFNRHFILNVPDLSWLGDEFDEPAPMDCKHDTQYTLTQVRSASTKPEQGIHDQNGNAAQE